MRRMFIVLGVLFWAAASAFANLAQRDSGKIFLLLDSPVTAAQAREIAAREAEEETPAGFCFYAVREGERLYCPDNGHGANATVLSVSGNGMLLGAEALSWAGGCVVDESTAQTLFGTAVGDGQQVTWGGKNRTVLGTFSALSPTALVFAEDTDSLDACVFACEDENGSQDAQAFLLRHSLSGRILNFYPLYCFTKNFSLLPLWVLLALLCAAAGRRRKWLGWLVAAAGLVLLGSRVIIPGDAIPSVWSDFSFWGDWLQAQRENLLAILAWGPVDRALQMEQNMVKSLLCALAGSLAAAAGKRR